MCAHSMSRAQGDGEPREVQELLGRGKELGCRLRMGDAEQRGPPLRSGGDQTAVLQTREMLGHGGLGQPQMLGQLHDPVLTVQQMLKDHQAGAVTEPVEQARRSGEGSLGAWIDGFQ